MSFPLQGSQLSYMEYIDDITDIDLGIDDTLVTKTKRDIIEGMTFEDENEKLLCTSIIDDFEKTIADGYHNMKIMKIPTIGVLRKNPFQVEFFRCCKTLHEIYLELGSQKFQEYVKALVWDIKKDVMDKDIHDVLNRILTNKNKNKYKYFYRLHGKYYATLYMMSIMFLEEVPYIGDWDEE